MTIPTDAFPEERPPATAGLIALGVLTLLFGIACVLMLALFLLGEAMKDGPGQAQGGFPPEIQQKMNEIEAEPSRRLATLVGIGLTTLMGLSLMVASIGIFMRRPWGWKLAIASLSAVFAWIVLSIIITSFIVQPRIQPMVEEFLEMVEEEPDMPPGLGKMLTFQYGAGSSMLISVCCCVPLPLILFIGLWMPGIRSQFFPPPHDDMAGPMADFPPPPVDPGPLEPPAADPPPGSPPDAF